MMIKKIIHTSTIPGLEYEVTKIGNNRYVKVIHKLSGIPVINFTSEPVKVKAVISLCEEKFKGLNWEFPADNYTIEHTKAYLAVRRHKFK